MKVLILGYGYMGQIRHRVLRENLNVSDIKIYDPGLDGGLSRQQETFLSTDQPIPWEKFDAVFVCTPNHVTAQLAIDALKHCRNVFCEKPPGRNWEDFSKIQKVAQAIPEHKIVFGFNHRLHPSILAAKSLVGGGGMGRILYMKGTYGKSGGRHYRESWRNNKEKSGGGILLDQGIHMLDIFNTFLGRLKVKDAVLKDSFWKCGVEDNAFVLFESKEGVPAFLHSSATLWKHQFGFEIGCENGYLLVKGFLSKSGSYGREQLVIGKRQFEDEAFALGNPREEIVHFDKDESWEKEVDEFIQCVKEDRAPNHGTLKQAEQVMKIIQTVYERDEKKSKDASLV